MVDGGFPPREIDTFTLADVNLVYAEWGRLPPLRVMAAAYLGIKPGGSRSNQSTPLVRDAASIKAMNPGGVLR